MCWTREFFSSWNLRGGARWLAYASAGPRSKTQRRANKRGKREKRKIEIEKLQRRCPLADQDLDSTEILQRIQDQLTHVSLFQHLQLDPELLLPQIHSTSTMRCKNRQILQTLTISSLRNNLRLLYASISYELPS